MGVLVPAGLVLHDHVTLLDPVLFKRNDIERSWPRRPAPTPSTSPPAHPESRSSSG